jgi:Tol biopolymer transport system component
MHIPTERPAPDSTILVSVLCFLQGCGVLIGPMFSPVFDFNIPLASLVLGVGFVRIAFGLQTHKPWAYPASFSFALTNILLGLIGQGLPLTLGQLLSVLLPVAILALLFQPSIHLLRQPRQARWLVIGLVASLGVGLLAVWLLPRHLSATLSAQNPRWSPDGTTIVADCALRYDDAWDIVFAYEVCLAQPDLSGLVRLAPDYYNWQSLQPTWSPSGAELVFRRPQGGLLLLTVRTGSTRLLTEAYCANPNWAPDGHTIACTSWDDTITLVEVGSGRVTRLTVPGADTLRWTNNGAAIILVKTTSLDPYRSAISLLDLSTSEERRLVEDVASGGQLTLSPDGAQLAYATSTRTSIEVLNLHSGAREDLLAAYQACLNSISDPEWSPDGRYLAFAAERRRSSNGAQIYIIEIQHRAVFQLTNFAEDVSTVFLGTPAWSPDGAFLATHTVKPDDRQHFRVVMLPTATAKLTPVSCQ